MKYQSINAFTGINKGVHPRALPDDKLYDARNVYFKDGRVYTRPGYDTLGTNLPLSGAVLCLNQFTKLRTPGSTLIAITENSFYEYSETTELWTEHANIYNTGTVSQPYGTEYVFNAASTAYTSVTYLDSTHFIIAYQDTGNSSHGTAIMGTVVPATGTITYGSEFVFNAASTNSPSVVHLDSTHFVVAYPDDGNSSHGTAIMGTVVLATGAITYGSEFVFNAAGTGYISTTYLDSTHFVVTYMDAGNSNRGTAIMGTVVLATGAITYGSEFVFNAGITFSTSVIYLDSTHFVVVYQDVGNSSYGTAIMGTVVLATGAITYGSEFVFNAASTNFPSITYLDSTHFVIAYIDIGNSSYGTAIMGTVVLATGAITYGSEFVFNAGNTASILTHYLDSTHFIIAYQDVGNSSYGTAIMGTVVLATGAITYGSEYVFNAASTAYTSVTYLDSTHFIVTYADTGNSSHGTAVYFAYSAVGSGTTWGTTWPDLTYDIKFGTNSLTGTGTPDIWFKIKTPSTTTLLDLELTNDMPIKLLTGATNYVIRLSYASTSTDFYSSANIIEGLGGADEKELVLTNYVDPIQVYNGTTLVTLDMTGDGGTAPISRAKYVAYYHGCVVLAYCYGTANMPQTVQWSARGFPTYWSTLGASYADLIQGDDYITGMEVYKQRLYIFKQRSIVECYYTGTTDPIFEFTEDKVKGIGQPYGRTIVNTGEILIFKGEDNIYTFNGFQPTPIGDAVIQHIKDNESITYRNMTYAAHIAREYLYLLFIVKTGSTEPDLCYILNYLTGLWSIWNFHDNFRVTGPYSNSDYVIFGDSLGYIYRLSLIPTILATDNSNSIVAYIETKDYPLNDFKHYVRLLETILVLKTNTGTIQIKCSVDFGQTWSSAISIDQNTTNDIVDHLQNWMIKGKQVRFKIENVSGSQIGLESLMIGFDDAGI